MMNKSTERDNKPRFYIEELGDGTLGNELANLALEGSSVSEHRGMECRDRQGKQIVRDLYEVTADVKDRICRMARRAGFQFVIYQAKGDDLPRDIDWFLAPSKNPFAQARASRRRSSGGKARPVLRRLPFGVARGLGLPAIH